MARLADANNNVISAFGVIVINGWQADEGAKKKDAVYVTRLFDIWP